jgi:hypothetical protein
MILLGLRNNVDRKYLDSRPILTIEQKSYVPSRGHMEPERTWSHSELTLSPAKNFQTQKFSPLACQLIYGLDQVRFTSKYEFHEEA